MTNEDRAELLADLIAERFQVPRKAVRKPVDRGTGGPGCAPEPTQRARNRGPA